MLEYGGGVGRLGRVIAPHVRRLVSVDIAPIMKTWGRRLSPGVAFHDLDEVAAAPEFDGAYSLAVFFHLALDEQKRALEYVHGRLKAGGWFPVDVRVGPARLGHGVARENGLDRPGRLPGALRALVHGGTRRLVQLRIPDAQAGHEPGELQIAASRRHI